MSNGLPTESRVYPRGRVPEQLARTLSNTYNRDETRDKIRTRIGDDPMRTARDASRPVDREASARAIEQRIKDVRAKRVQDSRSVWRRLSRQMSQRYARSTSRR